MGQQDEGVFPFIYVHESYYTSQREIKKTNKLRIKSIVIKRGHRNWEPAKVVEVANSRRTNVVQT